jgi:hypothetical protein
VSYEKEVYVGEQVKFSVELIDFSNEKYDIKIDVLVDEKRVGKILNEEVWKSTNYYINSALESSGDFYLIFDTVCEAAVVFKVRDSKDKVYSFFGYEIKILEKPEEERKEKEINSEEEDMKVEKKEVVEEVDSLEKEEFIEEKKSVVAEVIILNPKNIKSEDSKVSLGKSDYAIYGLPVFCVLLALLFIFRKKKNGFE